MLCVLPPTGETSLRPSTRTWLAFLSLGISMLMVGPGCAAKRAANGEVVQSINFRGNGGPLQGTTDFSLRGAMDQGVSGSFAWIAPSRRVLLDREALVMDAWRLETWFAHRGFFDARFRAWDIITVRPENTRRGPVVRIVGYVDPGPETLVSDVVLEGMEVIGAPLRGLILRQAATQVGDRFDLGALDETEAQVEARLKEQGYAHAKVQPDVLVDPEELTAAVTLSADLGPSCTFGEVTILGSSSLPERLIRDEIRIVTGNSYQLSLLAATQRRLFALGTFSVVNVSPVLVTTADGTRNDVVDVRVELGESKFRQIRVGGGVALESGRQEVSVGTSFTHSNVLNRLWRLEAGLEVGYASLLSWSELGAQGLQGITDEGAPVAKATVGLDIPRFPARAWRLENEVGVELGVEPEYQFVSPEGSTALLWQMSRRWSTRYGYAIQYFDYFNSDLPDEVSLLDRDGQRLGLDFSDPYVLSYLFQQLKYDSRDDVLYTRRGSYGVLDLHEAGGLVGGRYNFVKAHIDGRIYRPLPRILGWRQRITLTARLAGGAAVPYGAEDRANVPFAERLMLGGSSTVRGWVRDHLGPYIYECVDPETQEISQCTSAVAQRQPYDGDNVDNDDIIYIGGRAALYGGVEARGYWSGGLLNDFGGALFADFGRAWDGAAVDSVADLQARLSQISVALGTGVRYRSPVGPIRLDFARRMDSFPMFYYEPRWQVHFGLSEAW